MAAIVVLFVCSVCFVFSRGFDFCRRSRSVLLAWSCCLLGGDADFFLVILLFTYMSFWAWLCWRKCGALGNAWYQGKGKGSRERDKVAAPPSRVVVSFRFDHDVLLGLDPVFSRRFPNTYLSCQSSGCVRPL